MQRRRTVLAVLAAMAVCAGGVVRGQAPATASAAATLDRPAQAEFLRSAKVIRSVGLSTGVTSPFRLTLSDGAVTHDGSFQSVNERASQAN